MKFFKIIFYNFVFLLILYFLLEIFSGNFFFKAKLNCSYLLCDANYQYKTNFYSEEKAIINYKKDKYGFRGRRKELNEIDIIAVGGSTTDERYLNEKNTWTEQLETLFISDGKNIDIVNAGIDGQSTYGHIWNYDNWYKKIDKLKTKYFIFYIGVNEKKLAQSYDMDYKNLSLIKKIKFLIKNNNGITWKLYKYFFYEIKDELNVGHKKREGEYFEMNNKKIDLDKKFFNEFSVRLNALYEKSINFNSIPIFVTQKTLRWKKENNKYYSINKKINYYEREAKISNKILKFCKSKKLICVDIFSDFDLILKDSYDLVHLNPQGSKKLAEIIYKSIKNLNF